MPFLAINGSIIHIYYLHITLLVTFSFLTILEWEIHTIYMPYFSNFCSPLWVASIKIK